MQTRGLADFRADYNVWRKDLAQQLGIREAELERLELTGEVPEEFVQKLTAEYHLPEGYFTEDAERAAVLAAAAERYEPKKPLAYFFKTALAWTFLVGVAQYVITLPSYVAALFDYAVNDFFTVIIQICLCVVNIVSGIYLGSHIVKKTNFRGSIADYEFLYPYFPSTAVAGLSAVFSLILPNDPRALSESVSDGSGFLTSEIEILSLALPLISGLLMPIVLVALSITFLAYFLDTAARAQGPEKDKRLKILCAVVLASEVLSYVVRMANGTFFQADALTWISRVLSFLLLLAVLYGVLFGVQKNPRLKTLWLTVLPIVAMALPTVFSVLRQF